MAVQFIDVPAQGHFRLNENFYPKGEYSYVQSSDRITIRETLTGRRLVVNEPWQNFRDETNAPFASLADLIQALNDTLFYYSP